MGVSEKLRNQRNGEKEQEKASPSVININQVEQKLKKIQRPKFSVTEFNHS